jgi:ribonuclease H2 subunit C
LPSALTAISPPFTLSPGIVANSTDRLLANDPAKTRPAFLEESPLEDLDDKEDAAEPVMILEAVATFDEVTIWGHDQLPPVDDAFVKGIEEWIAFAEAIHSASATENRSDNKAMN